MERDEIRRILLEYGLTDIEFMMPGDDYEEQIYATDPVGRRIFIYSDKAVQRWSSPVVERDSKPWFRLREVVEAQLQRRIRMIESEREELLEQKETLIEALED